MKRNKLLLATLTLLSFSAAFAQETTKEKKDSINNLQEVEIFGDRNKKQRGLEAITRFPVSPNQQIQTISTISEKLIEEQGALTITDAARNVPGVTLFGSYGGNRESMSIRGYRGTPVLRNGVRQDSDFRTAGAISDMQGIESIQVIKGSAAITQGVGNGLGSAGGVINLVTKTPRFNNSGNIGLRVGSWNQIRTTFDVQRVVDEAKTFAFRINGAYQQADSYRDVVNSKRFYIQPSVAWRPDEKTEVIAEMDYLDFDGVPDRGTVNLAGDDVQALANMGHRFLGFNTDFDKSEAITYSLRATRNLTDKISVRAAYYASYNDRDQQGTGLGLIKKDGETLYNQRSRSLSRSTRNDRNSTIQIDVMGKEFKSGILTWNWQAGYDYTTYRVDSRSAQIDTGRKDQNGDPIYTTSIPVPGKNIENVLGTIDNTMPSNFDWSQLNINTSSPLDEGYYYGFMTQHHLSITDYVKVVGALRWSYSGVNSKDVLDPMIGLMLSPTKNINIFGSYTTTSSLRSATNPLEQGGTVGTSRTKQFETGVKTSWFNDRFRANVTYFDMKNENLSYQVLNDAGNATGYYGLAGNLNRKGIEFDISGRILPNLQVLLGYAYLDATYEDSPAYVNGSRPMNAPYNTANAWIQYKFQNTNSFVDGLSLSAGVYYVGSRPVNEYAQKTFLHNTTPGVKPFLMPEYTTLNAQVGYSLKRFDFRLFFNNITDEIGYNSYYRGGYINQIDPFNMAGQIVFKF
ncbi:TonB-dependent receptor plug domain-containing protein [Empedobacter brevis]|uniref:Ferrichrome-iron receptor n=2 Tax=Empedobacter brevis TaxID=247 RepID=A0A511NEZ9_9FLAO|nr:TonB-dependent receptor [Empedobacter brevis]QES92542.1 TonB-dependent receptor plug domain-containing protein [Empedobacter brevis]GEM51058.1 ferrichrome-iron receptor [Empedobacter brevis NBRC 14943 = ATCC 43319]